jgi:hypothetical protein
MLVPYLRDADTTSMLMPYLRAADTTNMLVPYLRDADTTNMLVPYLRDADTTNMLVPYLRDADTTSMLVPYLRDADTSAMLTPYLKKESFPQTPTEGDILYYSGNKWVSLPKGQNGQVLTLIDGVPAWTGLVVPTIITTNSITNITASSADSGGNVIYDGGVSVTARGLVYGTSPNPTLSNSVSTIGSGLGTFSGTISGLSAGTTYYVRSYATNSAGTTYGNQQTFTTN